MSTEFKREEHYIVFKLTDLGNSLKGDEVRQLAREYAEQRRLKGKSPLDCVVVESDWPEYEPTRRAIETRVTGAQAQNVPTIPDGWKLVPIEPTFEMLDKGLDQSFGYVGVARDVWAAMLAVAPEAKP